MYKILKTLLDKIIAMIGIIIFLPIIIIVSICIKLSGKGPILFKQTRLGQNAIPFKLYRFRTMYVDNEQINEQIFVKNLINGKYGEFGLDTQIKINNDPRITFIGRFLKKSSLDEIPQFFNVLWGDMSAVGPRPPLPYEYERYEEWHKERLSVKPGITGLWQIDASATSFDEMVRLDIEYARRQSILLDLKILLKTPWVVLTGKGVH